MELKSPTPKRKGYHILKSAPLPVFCHGGSFFDDLNTYGTFSGLFNGNSVIVDEQEEIKALYSMGCFGKASLSRGYPNFDKHKKDEPLLLKEYQWERRKDWSVKLEKLLENFRSKNCKTEDVSDIEMIEDQGNSSSASISPIKLQENVISEIRVNDDTLTNNKDVNSDNSEVNLSISDNQKFSESLCSEIKNILVINGSIDDNFSNLNPRIETERLKTVVEVLLLSLEEAFFLSFALGCLQVLDLSGKTMSLTQLWRTFNSSQSDFIENYIAYHYFRAKGWVVKSGMKYGGQFLLYKEGPAFYHASYVVLIENINPIGDRNMNKEGCLTWDKMNSLNRMAETCNKEILVCKIQWPTVTEHELENPLIIKKFKVKEYLLKRWQPCHEKDSGSG